MKSYAVVIPARLASTRLPNKPLVDILGKSLIERTYNQVIQAIDPNKVYVLTDDEIIINHCKERGIQVVLTSKNCLTGTDRVAEFAEMTNFDYYINVQGDEPLMNPNNIEIIIEQVENSDGEILNGYAEIDLEEDFRSLTIPKVVFRPDGRLLYMSRSAIPGNKNGEFTKAFKQVCVYAFPKKALIDFYKCNSKTFLENIEDIEILRFLELGYEVRMLKLSKDSIAVDVPEDIEKVIIHLSQSND
ncbi:3-deoxy-manno-octulosonate cytidylyltransferase [Cloacibacterium normanense]|uniref:3-deoxy-manno-octulosonate cytidylyltransferase n=1 Tax=Cloacibacterium normanense TaxID=237258 RepID=A0A2S7I1W8_9FLAO|nr:3-deoxy-manno-octulosonate cytidylyltransferase [Cloacibacterium normanense]PPZ90580.1 3-deoxy-manno-octulosonate cytidylyltransferase [Cloacibacterium normanense]